jgi:hypothetical protein
MLRYFKKEISKKIDTPVLYEVDDMLFNIPE